MLLRFFGGDFPEFEIVRYNSEIIHGQIREQILEDIQTADLVIADLTELTTNGYYELGARHASGLPTVLLAQTGHAIPFDMKDHRFVIYSYKATDDEVENPTLKGVPFGCRYGVPIQRRLTPGSRIIVTGIISMVVGGAGFSAVTVYTLTLAFWQGPEIFAKAIEALKGKK